MSDWIRTSIIIGGTLLLHDLYYWMKERHGTKCAVLILIGIFIIFFGIATVIDARLK